MSEEQNKKESLFLGRSCDFLWIFEVVSVILLYVQSPLVVEYVLCPVDGSIELRNQALITVYEWHSLNN